MHAWYLQRCLRDGIPPCPCDHSAAACLADPWVVDTRQPAVWLCPFPYGVLLLPSPFPQQLCLVVLDVAALLLRPGPLMRPGAHRLKQEICSPLVMAAPSTLKRLPVQQNLLLCCSPCTGRAALCCAAAARALVCVGQHCRALCKLGALALFRVGPHWCCTG
jgi:hypothetical protein